MHVGARHDLPASFTTISSTAFDGAPFRTIRAERRPISAKAFCAEEWSLIRDFRQQDVRKARGQIGLTPQDEVAFSTIACGAFLLSRPESPDPEQGKVVRELDERASKPLRVE